MKLADWSGHNGIDYKTIYRLFKSGRFPRSVEQLPTGTILVYELPNGTSDASVYARVSSAARA